MSIEILDVRATIKMEVAPSDTTSTQVGLTMHYNGGPSSGAKHLANEGLGQIARCIIEGTLLTNQRVVLPRLHLDTKLAVRGFSLRKCMIVLHVALPVTERVVRDGLGLHPSEFTYAVWIVETNPTPFKSGYSVQLAPTQSLCHQQFPFVGYLY